MIIFSLLAVKVHAESIEICGDLKQGELVLVKDANAKIFSVYENVGIDEFKRKQFRSAKERKYPVSDDGVILVALHRDAPKKMLFAGYPETDMGTIYELEIAPSKWDIQRINGVQQSKVTPSKNAGSEIVRERKDVGRAVTNVQRGDFWKKGFVLPVDGKVSGHFGNQRIFNGVPKNPHTGTDIAAPEGTPVKASGDGVVILSGKDYFYTGNMVILDHGQGLQTIYAHLKSATVNKNDVVKQGEIIGYVGKTGRATGPHLHWGASLNNIRFRPHSLLDINEKKCKVYEGVYAGDFTE